MFLLVSCTVKATKKIGTHNVHVATAVSVTVLIYRRCKGL